MNILKTEKKEAVIRCLVNGSSIRATERIVGVHRDTIMRLLVRVGQGCKKLMDDKLRNLNCRHIQLDEIWEFVGKKQRRLTENDNPDRVGDFWTFVAIDTDTRLVPSYKIGKRDLLTAKAFIEDLSNRLSNRVLLSSDSLRVYVEAIDSVFGANVDYGQIVKSYDAEPIGPGRYSPRESSNRTKRPDWEILIYPNCPRLMSSEVIY